MLPASRSKDYSPRAAGYLYATSEKLKKKKTTCHASSWCTRDSCVTLDKQSRLLEANGYRLSRAGLAEPCKSLSAVNFAVESSHRRG